MRNPTLTLALLLALAACSSDPNPDDTRPPGDLTILRLAEGTPPLVTDSAGFWAVAGEDREVRIDIAPDQDYLKFRVRDDALLRYPDGTLFAPGDSVFITVKVINPDSLYFQFTPSGLTFRSDEPAELSLDYDHAGFTIEGDYDNDGDSDSDDEDLETEFGVWQQENAGDPFVRLQGLIEVEVDEINVDILSFTRYALAY
jgi:hypothetical protein